MRVISAITGVSEKTICRRMTEYDLKIRDFSKVSDNQLDLEVLPLTNDYPFCGEIMLRELVKDRSFNVERWQYSSCKRLERLSSSKIQTKVSLDVGLYVWLTLRWASGHIPF